MRLSFILYLPLLFLPLETRADSTALSDEIELSYHLGPMQLGQTNDWLNADTLISPIAIVTTDDESPQLSSCAFDLIETPLLPLPCFLNPLHPRNFVVVYPEQQITFSITYSDPFGNTPSPGYPKVTLYKNGDSGPLTFHLDSVASSIFQKTLLLSPGDYYYYYSVMNDKLSAEYSLETSSFVVTQRPSPIENRGVANDVAVSNARVSLCWASFDPGGEALCYTLRLGSNPDSLSLIYEGFRNTFEVTGLNNQQRYYWQVEAANKYGVSSLSPLFSFSTVSFISKAFNYPNPFNPATGQKTNIAFTMPAAGNAEIAILTELGDLCWRQSFENLLTGVNEVPYNGKDDRGNTLYNGTYICHITKRFDNRKENDTCRILVIK